MTKELRVYNRFGELILYLRLIPGHFLPLQVVLGSWELREAVNSLRGHDFDRTVFVDGQHRRFTARWATPEYLDALAGYWESNFRWRTEIRSDAIPVEDMTSQPDLRGQSLGLGGGPVKQLALCGGAANPNPNRPAKHLSFQIPMGELESTLGIASGVALQGGSLYGATVGAPG